MTSANLLHAHGLTLDTPGGRPLFRDLTLILNRGERVALVGRNGAGKSSLLEALSGLTSAKSGEVDCYGQRAFVPQSIELRPGASPGEARRSELRRAFETRADLLILDEPTHDLDRDGVRWLTQTLRDWRNGLIVVSHDRRLLREFREFFVVAEGGCHHFSGSCDALIAAQAREQAENEQRYVRQLATLTAHEQRQFRVRQRRERKKNVGRVRELGRATPTIRLNSKRSYAQEKQGKRNLIQRDRIEAARAWAEAARRALSVDLPLATTLPVLPAASPEPIVRLEHVNMRAGDRTLFDDLTLELSRERLAVLGPNGAGKSTLLQLLAGASAPERGRSSHAPERIGYIAQNAANWRMDESLVEHLTQACQLAADAAASCIHAHKFPFALAARPLVSLSPGERLRAALICLLHRPSPPELLILDEPTSHLDFLGYDALLALLSRWTGGLVVASHDDELIRAIGLDRQIQLEDGAHSTQALAPGWK